MIDVLAAEIQTWAAYVAYCTAKARAGENAVVRTVFLGDARSEELWLRWKASWDARRAALMPIWRTNRSLRRQGAGT